MKARLQQFLDAENLTQAQFADSIKVARPNVNHVLSGRNNPGYDFIVNTMKAYPELNIDWLLTGKGKMYKDKNGQKEPARPYQDTIFPELDDSPTFQNSGEESDSPASVATSDSDKKVVQTVKTIVKQRNITKIIVFFDDGSFQEMGGTSGIF